MPVLPIRNPDDRAVASVAGLADAQQNQLLCALLEQVSRALGADCSIVTKHDVAGIASTVCAWRAHARLGKLIRPPPIDEMFSPGESAGLPALVAIRSARSLALSALRTKKWMSDEAVVSWIAAPIPVQEGSSYWLLVATTSEPKDWQEHHGMLIGLFATSVCSVLTEGKTSATAGVAESQHWAEVLGALGGSLRAISAAIGWVGRTPLTQEQQVVVECAQNALQTAAHLVEITQSSRAGDAGSNAADLGAVHAGGSARSSDADASVLDLVPLLDLEKTLARLGGNRALLQKISAAFVSGIGERMKSLRGAIDAEDRAAAAREVHRIGGQVATFEALRAKAQVDVIKREVDLLHWALAKGYFGHLESEVNELCQALSGLQQGP